MYVCTYIHIQMRIRVCVYVYIYIYIYIYMCVCVYIHTYTDADVQSSKTRGNILSAPAASLLVRRSRRSFSKLLYKSRAAPEEASQLG